MSSGWLTTAALLLYGGMMSEEKSLSEVLASPVPCMINGKAQFLYPLTIKQHAELDAWIRGDFLTAALMAINSADDLSENHRTELKAEAIRTAMEQSFFGEGSEVRMRNALFAVEYTIRMAHKHFEKDLGLSYQAFKEEFVKNLEENTASFFGAVQMFAKSFSEVPVPENAEELRRARDGNLKRCMELLIREGWTLAELQELTTSQLVFAVESLIEKPDAEPGVVSKSKFVGGMKDFKKWLKERMER